MLKSTIRGLEKALLELRELERLSELDNVMALFDAMNSDPIEPSLTETADETRPRRRRRKKARS